MMVCVFFYFGYLISVCCCFVEDFGGFNVRVTFENNGCVTSNDASVEACCLYVLHRFVFLLRTKQIIFFKKTTFLLVNNQVWIV
jgi:hypothetical protein